MRSTLRVSVALALMGIVTASPAVRAQGQQAPAAPQAAAADADDPVRALVGRLDLEKYKATIKGLTQFGDRRQGTDRNRAAIDWIEAQLKSYGCTNTERIKYDYQPPAGRGGAAGAGRGAGAAAAGQAGEGRGAGRGEGAAGGQRGAAAGVRVRAAARSSATAAAPASTTIRPRSPISKLRELNSQPTHARRRATRSSAPRSAPRAPTRCTSSAATWTASATARPPTTTARARRW